MKATLPKQPSLPAEFLLRVFHSPEPGLCSGIATACLAAICEGNNRVDLICKKLRPSTERTIRAALLSLERAGFLTVQRGSAGINGRRKNIYTLKLCPH